MINKFLLSLSFQHNTREEKHLAKPRGTSPLHTSNVIQTQTNDNVTAGKQLGIERFVGCTKREHSEYYLEDDKHDLLPLYNVNTGEQAEQFSVGNVEHFEQQISENTDRSKVLFEQGAQDFPLETSVSNDRSLEQFSEVLLDSDSSTSNPEIIANEVVDKKRDGKRVRFADQFHPSTTECNQGKAKHDYAKG